MTECESALLLDRTPLLKPGLKTINQVGIHHRNISKVNTHSYQSNYTRRRFFGRHPLCGTGVRSSMAVTRKPELASAVAAGSRPAPGPCTRISISFMPAFRAIEAHASAAFVAANGVDFRDPLNPEVPPDFQQIVSPFTSVIVTIVLLKVDRICAIPRVTFLRTLPVFLAIDQTFQLLSLPSPHTPKSLITREPLRTGQATHCQFQKTKLSSLPQNQYSDRSEFVRSRRNLPVLT